MIVDTPYSACHASRSKWIENIPDNWELKRLRHVASFSNSNVDKKDYEGQEVVRVCNYTDVYYNEFITSNLPFMQATASPAEIEKFTLRRGDVIITKDSEDPTDIGIASLVKEDLPGVVCGYHLTILRSSSYDTARLLHRILQSAPTKAHFFVEAPGVTRYGLSQEAIGGLKMCLPPQGQHRTIADYLDRETARIDLLIKKKKHLIDALKEKRRAFVAAAVTKGIDPKLPMRKSSVEWLGEVPAHWEERRMASIYREAVRPGDPLLPVLSISIHDGISDDEIAPEDRDRQVSHIEDRTKYKRVAPGDLAYNMMRAWQGAFGAVTVDGLVSPAYVVAEPTGNVRSAYIEHLLRTPMAVEEMRRYSRGIADFRMRLYWDYFRDLRVCLPPLKEQDEILDRIRDETERLDRLTEKTNNSIELLKERRIALITAAVTGQIDLREAS